LPELAAKPSHCASLLRAQSLRGHNGIGRPLDGPSGIRDVWQRPFRQVDRRWFSPPLGVYTYLRLSIMMTLLIFILFDLFALPYFIGLESAEILAAVVAAGGLILIWILWLIER